MMHTVTASRMKQIEKQANDAGLSYLQMMENAGTAAADALLREVPDLRTAAIFCGTGNNGGDGYVMARLLKKRGADVLLILTGGKPKTPDATTNFYLAAMEDIPMVTGDQLNADDLSLILSADAVVDAIYGTGFHGELPLEGEICCGVINRAKGLKLAVDLPSGVACDTGEIAPGAVRADRTVTFHAMKPCHTLAADQCGTVEVADIGIRL